MYIYMLWPCLTDGNTCETGSVSEEILFTCPGTAGNAYTYAYIYSSVVL